VSYISSDVASQPLDDQIAAARQRLLNHPIYRRIDALHSTRFFMEHHVFAVWDFMSLLKRLQLDLTGCRLPWLPRPDVASVRLINEIALVEESDEDGQGGHCSHFELYLRAMRELGADTRPIEQFLQVLASGMPVSDAIAPLEISETIKSFVANTMAVAQHGETVAVAAAFFYGREDVIPEMFERLLPALKQQGSSVDTLVYYVKRHIEINGSEHGKHALRLMQTLCGEQADLWLCAKRSALAAIEARIMLWDGVLAGLDG
jgi:hypothetical protein